MLISSIALFWKKKTLKIVLAYLASFSNLTLMLSKHFLSNKLFIDTSLISSNSFVPPYSTSSKSRTRYGARWRVSQPGRGSSACPQTTWSGRQVCRHWLYFFLFPFCENSLICLEGKSMPPGRGNTILFRSSQQLPRLRLVRCFRNYRDTRTPSGVLR